MKNRSIVIAIDVDAQQTFSPLCPNELPVANATEIVDELNAQAQLADFRVMTKDAHSEHAVWVAKTAESIMQPVSEPHSENVDIQWPRHAEVGTQGFELLPNLPQPEQYDFLVYKGVERDIHPYGACFHDLNEKISTGLIEWLRDKKAEILIVGGLATDYCVKNTVLQLARHGNWKIIVNLGACRGIAENTINQAIQEMQQAGVQIVHNSQEIVIEK